MEGVEPNPRDAKFWTLRIEKAAKQLAKCVGSSDSVLNQVESLLVQVKSNLTLSPEENPRDIRCWTLRVEKVARKLTKYVGDSAFDYLDSLYTDFAVSRKGNDIFEAIVCSRSSRNGSELISMRSFQLSEAQNEWKQSEEVLKRVSSVLHSLQDLGLYTTMPDEDLQKLHASKELLYQTLLA
ncbi:hypothetical protein C0993_012019 [Termitomyces sp. T159_Od127]|nr:hypothetical protein C0993_012019 [Termitomyces sp. T159_Od127]